MPGRILAGPLLALLAVPPAIAQDVPAFRVWEWRKLRNQLDDRRLAAVFAADEAKLPDAATFDKLVVDTLRDVHDRGAELYNTAMDYSGTYRMYEGALRTVRPLLAHRPAAQKIIEDGLAAAAKESSDAQKAVNLHKVIEAVRKHLREVANPSGEPKNDPKTPPDVAPPPKVKKDDKKPEEVKKPKAPPAAAGSLSGRVTYKGQPLAAAEVTLVSLDLANPRVLTAVVKDGTYAFKESLPPGRYVVLVTGKNVPDKYATTTTSGLVIDVKAGAGNYDLDLK